MLASALLNGLALVVRLQKAWAMASAWEGVIYASLRVILLPLFTCHLQCVTCGGSFRCFAVTI